MDSITEIERKLRYDVQVSNLKQLKRNVRQGFITLLLFNRRRSSNAGWSCHRNV